MIGKSALDKGYTEIFGWGCFRLMGRFKTALPVFRVLWLMMVLVVGWLSVSWAAGSVPVRMAYLQNDIHHLSFWVATEKRIFAEEGVVIDSVGAFRAGPEIMSAFAAGDLDMAYVGQSPATTGVANKAADVVAVAQVNTEGSAIVIERDAVGFRNLKDLEGRTIAIPGHSTVQEAVLLKGLSKEGLSRQEVNLIVLKPPDMINSLHNGQIDAFIAWEPYPAQAITSGIGRMLAPSQEIWAEHPCCVLVVARTFLEEHPKIVAGVIRAHVRATRYIRKHPEDVVDIAVKYTGMGKAAIQKAIQNVHFTTELNIEGARKYVNFLSELGYIKKQDPETFIRSFIYPDFLPSESQ